MFLREMYVGNLESK